LSASACGGDAEAPKDDPLAGLTIVSADPSGAPLRELDTAWRKRFDRGDALFEQLLSESQGLGPVYIRQACASCHADDARGPGVVRKMVLIGDDGAPLDDQGGLPFGHTVRPQHIASASEGITAPEDRDDLLVTTRSPPAVFGRGYLEAILDSEIERVAAEQKQAAGEVSGRINRVVYRSEPNPDPTFNAHRNGDTGLIGRFGLKARIATLDEFAADAYQGDMGITSPLRPDELPNPNGPDDARPGVDIDADTVNRVADYMRALRIPARDEEALNGRGAELFAEVGCDACHVPSLHTDPDYPLAPLADVDAPVYTDLLLHDMGPAFGDGLLDYDAKSTEWRTAPLIGLRHLRTYLHDGRAKSVEDAIEFHGGEGSEARGAVDRMLSLAEDERAELLRFVSAL
jgi:CxxC motif-containing protein (DUF1111 family)